MSDSESDRERDLEKVEERKEHSPTKSKTNGQFHLRISMNAASKDREEGSAPGSPADEHGDVTNESDESDDGHKSGDEDDDGAPARKKSKSVEKGDSEGEDEGMDTSKDGAQNGEHHEDSTEHDTSFDSTEGAGEKSFTIQVTAAANKASRLQRLYDKVKTEVSKDEELKSDRVEAAVLDKLLNVYQEHADGQCSGSDGSSGWYLGEGGLNWLLSQMGSCFCGQMREIQHWWQDGQVPVMKFGCANNHTHMWHGTLGEAPDFDPEEKELKEVPNPFKAFASAALEAGEKSKSGKGDKSKGGQQAGMPQSLPELMNMLNPMLAGMAGMMPAMNMNMMGMPQMMAMQNMVSMNQQMMQNMSAHMGKKSGGKKANKDQAASSGSSGSSGRPQPVMLVPHRSSSKGTPKQSKPKQAREDKVVYLEDVSTPSGAEPSGARKRKNRPVRRAAKRQWYGEDFASSPGIVESDEEVKMELHVDKNDEDFVADDESEDEVIHPAHIIMPIPMHDSDSPSALHAPWQTWGKSHSDMPDFMRSLNVNQMAIQGTHMYETVFYDEGGSLKSLFEELNPMKDFRCRLCGKTFTNKGAKGRHETVHKEKIYRCRWCDALRDTSIALLLHLRDDHHPSKPVQVQNFQCAQCKKEFTDIGDLNAHLKDRHTNRRGRRGKYAK